MAVSSYWRKNTSTRESVELANLLRALQKVAGHLGANAGRIEYKGMSPAAEGAILISPEWVTGEYPVPPEQVDFVIGHVVYEALHKIEWSTLVWKTLEPDMENMTALQKVYFQQMVTAGEDIYICRKSDLSVFGLYAAVLRKNQHAFTDCVTGDGLSVDELLRTWRSGLFPAAAHDGEKPQYKAMLSILNNLSRQLFEVAGSSRRVIDKCKLRASLYLDTWQEIAVPITRLPVYKKRLYWFHAMQTPGSPKPLLPENYNPGGRLTPHLAREIQASLAADAVDITPLIRSVAGYGNETVVPMSRWDFNMPSRPVIDKRMIGRLKATFRNYAARRTLVNRGLLSGRIDPGRLYRVPVNGRCFKEDLQIPNPDWSIALLIDASGSMDGCKWRMVESVVANLHKAISGDKQHFDAWAYFETGGICMFSRLLKDGRLMSVPPSGQTASGQAIIAAAMMVPKNKKLRILIHVTDGQSNFGCDVSYGIELCKKEGIYLVTLGCGCKDRKAMEAQYNKTIEFLDHFEQLPRAVENLVKTIFMHRAKMRPKHQGKGNTLWQT